MNQSKYPAIDLSNLKTYSIKERQSKVEIDAFAKPYQPGGSMNSFLASLPHILKANDLHALINHMIDAIQHKRPIIIMMGAHVIKCGLNPLLIDWLQSGYISSIALNGAGVIHDTEVALFGTTSEDVATALDDGSFGMVQETPAFINAALKEGRNMELGFGESVGKRIVESDNCPNSHLSLLATAYTCNIPVTVHVAIGTDIIHQHSNTDGATLGELSHRDFKIFCNQVKNIGDGGVVLNFGSAVILPEVFLKAISVTRNLGHHVHKFVTANFDMFQHYRPQVNVLQRPTKTGGTSYQFTGHHEIMIPLLFAGVKEGVAGGII
ncbi:hypothetical protein JW960_13575 [candidate division KSB1 bacterium]|nr:hypothetical protein [candidate division KSB1 bacterium]